MCFALVEEARPFERRIRGDREVAVLVTGMGRRNAEASVRRALSARRPGLVLTCGFAGGLDPTLGHGTVVFETDDAEEVSPGSASGPRSQLVPASWPLPAGTAGAPGRFEERLEAAGARRGRFHCADRIAVTTAEKRALRSATGAEAVEMESGAIRAVCHAAGIPCVTVRVISDPADEDLPLDFNRLMTPDQRLDSAKLALALLKSPGKLGALRRLQRHSQASAEKLARVVATVLAVG